MIVEDLYPEQEIATAFPGYWRMSGVGGCQKGLLALARGTVSGLTNNLLAAREGNLHELDILNRLQAKGYVVEHTSLTQQIEVELRDWRGVKWPLVGHPDGFIEVDMSKWLLELKSKDRFMYDRLKKGPVQEVFPVEYAQVQCYMASTDMDTCLYICKNRGTGQLYEEVIRFDGHWLDEFLLNHFGPVVDAYQNGTDLEELSCHSNEHVRRWCPMRYICEGAAAEPDVKVPDSVPISVSEAIGKWQAAKEMKDEAESLDKVARQTIREYMIHSGMKKAVIDGVPVTIYTVEMEKVDKDRARELLPEEVWSEVFSKDSGERMRIG